MNTEKFKNFIHLHPRLIFYGFLALILSTLWFLRVDIISAVMATLLYCACFLQFKVRWLLYIAAVIIAVSVIFFVLPFDNSLLISRLMAPAFFLFLAAAVMVTTEYLKFPYKFFRGSIRLSPGVLAIGIIIITAIFLISPSLLEPGLIFSGDFAFPYTLSGYFGDRFSTWSEISQAGTFQDIAHLSFLAPFIGIAKIFQFQSPDFVRMIMIVPYLIAGISFFVFINLLLSFQAHERRYRAFAALAGALLYMINIWLISRQAHYFLQVGYAFLPLILYFFLQAIRTKRWYYLVLTALALGLGGITPQFLAYIFLVGGITFLFLFSRYIYKKNWKSALVLGGKTILIILLFLGFFAFWILPVGTIYFSGHDMPAPAYIMRTGDIINSNENLNILSILSLSYPEIKSPALKITWQVIALIIPLLALLGWWFSRKNFWAGLLLAIAIAGLVLPCLFIFDTDLYFRIMFKFPVSWLLHDPSRTLGIVPLGYCGLVGFFLISILRSKKSYDKNS